MNTPTLKYPLPCGCAGPKYISMCEACKDQAILRHQEMMGLEVSSTSRDHRSILLVDEAIKTVRGSDLVMLDGPAAFTVKKSIIEVLERLKK